MPSRNLKIILAACCICLAGFAQAQDLHFSQFFNSPLTTNPANTGFIPDGDYRLGINYRDQWSTIMSMPYKTMSAYGDAQIMRNRFDNGWIGAGGVILRDVAGSGNLTSTKIYGSLAYHQMIGSGSLVSLGFNVGYANKQINASNLKFPDQFDGNFFDSKLPTSVAITNNNIGYLDMQAGMNYAYFPNSKVYLNGGFSAMHLNRPHESFFDDYEINTRVPVRYTGFLNGSFMVTEDWIINPNAYASFHAKSSEIVVGLNAHRNLAASGDYQLIGGLYYRYKDAVIPMLGLGYKDYTFTFTYDATVSGLAAYNNTRGAFEFALVKQGMFDQFNGNKRETLCPTFKTY